MEDEEFVSYLFPPSLTSLHLREMYVIFLH